MNRKLLYTLLVLLSIAAGFYLTYVVEGFMYLSIATRSLAILLFPVILTLLSTGVYKLIKKKNVSSSTFDKCILVFWVIGVSIEFITYNFL